MKSSHTNFKSLFLLLFLFEDDSGSFVFLVSVMINTLTALVIWLLDLRDVTMFGPLLARAVTPVFWIYMSPKLREIMAKLVGRR